MKYCIVRKLHICLYETAFVFRRYRWIILISFTHKALLLAKHRNQPLVILHSNSSSKAQQDFILESPIILHHRWVHPFLMRLGVNSVLNRKYILIASVIKYKPTHAAAYKMSLVHWYAYNKYLSKRGIERGREVYLSKRECHKGSSKKKNIGELPNNITFQSRQNRRGCILPRRCKQNLCQEWILKVLNQKCWVQNRRKDI